MGKIIHWFAKNHVAANSIMVVVTLVGFSTWFKLKKEIFPEIAIDVVSISVPYPNAAPEEVERGICMPIEDAIQDVDGIKRIRSTAVESVGSVSAEVETGYDTSKVKEKIKTRVDAITNFPIEAEEPIVEELLLKSQVMSIAISADTDEKTLRNLAEQVRDDLLNFSSPEPSSKIKKILSFLVGSGKGKKVSQASLAAARKPEISIEVSEQTLRELGITIQTVADAVRQSSLDLPSGSIRTKGGEILLRTNAKKYSEEEFAKITVLTRPDGSRVILGDIAQINDGFEENQLRNSFDGRNTILLNVFRVGDEDTLNVAAAVKDFIKDASRRYPQGVSFELWNDQSKLLEGRMDLLFRNLGFGLVLVFIVLALFLRPSLALLVALGIPVSFAGAILLMPYTGISINMISLFGFILVLGIVVDDAIVVGENVFRRMREGEDPKTAAPDGTHEVGVVVIFGVITTMVAFAPMLGLSGVMGKIWPNIPLIVIPTLMFSLLQSKLVLPSHLSLLPRIDPNKPVRGFTKFRRFFTHGLEKFVEKVYSPFLGICLKARWVVMLCFVLILVIAIVFIKLGYMKYTFFPDIEGEIVSAKLTMPKGVAFETTDAAIRRIEKAALKIRDEYKDRDGNAAVIHLLASTGTQPFATGIGELTGGSSITENIGEVTMELCSAELRDFTTREIRNKWRELVGGIPGAVELRFTGETEPGGRAIELELRGKSIEDLSAAAEIIKSDLVNYKGVSDISDSNIAGKRELKLDITQRGEALGLRLSDIANQIRQAFYGEEAQRLQRGNDEIKVLVRYPKEERLSLENLESMKIRTRDGQEVPFSEVATTTSGRGYSVINRNERQRSVTVYADIDNKQNSSGVVIAALITGEVPEETTDEKTTDSEKNPPEKKEGILQKVTQLYPDITYNFEGEQKEQAQSMQEMLQLFALALVVMYILLAIPLASYFQPLIIMAVIPFGLIGSLIGHIIMGYSLSIMSMCGIVALAGVVVNDSLVLVDYINRHTKSGHSHVEAAWKAGAARFRAILLTSMTTFAGLLPMLLETDLQAKFLQPMAVSLGFGILFATFITLILVPSLYLIAHDVKAFLKWIFRGGKKKNSIEKV